MKTKKKPKITRADLERKIVELNAQLAHVYHFVDAELHRAGSDALTASGVVVTLTALGGRKITEPFVVKNGLSDETIKALRRDIRRSYEDAVVFKPKGVDE